MIKIGCCVFVRPDGPLGWKHMPEEGPRRCDNFTKKLTSNPNINALSKSDGYHNIFDYNYGDFVQDFNKWRKSIKLPPHIKTRWALDLFLGICLVEREHVTHRDAFSPAAALNPFVCICVLLTSVDEEMDDLLDEPVIFKSHNWLYRSDFNDDRQELMNQTLTNNYKYPQLTCVGSLKMESDIAKLDSWLMEHGWPLFISDYTRHSFINATKKCNNNRNGEGQNKCRTIPPHLQQGVQIAQTPSKKTKRVNKRKKSGQTRRANSKDEPRKKNLKSSDDALSLANLLQTTNVDEEQQSVDDDLSMTTSSNRHKGNDDSESIVLKEEMDLTDIHSSNSEDKPKSKRRHNHVYTPGKVTAEQRKRMDNLLSNSNNDSQNNNNNNNENDKFGSSSEDFRDENEDSSVNYCSGDDFDELCRVLHLECKYQTITKKKQIGGKRKKNTKNNNKREENDEYKQRVIVIPCRYPAEFDVLEGHPDGKYKEYTNKQHGRIKIGLPAKAWQGDWKGKNPYVKYAHMVQLWTSKTLVGEWSMLSREYLYVPRWYGFTLHGAKPGKFKNKEIIPLDPNHLDKMKNFLVTQPEALYSKGTNSDSKQSGATKYVSTHYECLPIVAIHFWHIQNEPGKIWRLCHDMMKVDGKMDLSILELWQIWQVFPICDFAKAMSMLQKADCCLLARLVIAQCFLQKKIAMFTCEVDEEKCFPILPTFIDSLRLNKVIADSQGRYVLIHFLAV